MLRAIRGFTLIEMMIVVALIAVIATIAYPAYLDQVRKARRSDAKQSLFNVAGLLEQYYQDNKGYPAGGDMTDIGLADPYITPEGYYQIQFQGAATTSAYAIRATPRGDQVNDDTCYAFQLSSRGVKTNWKAGGTQITYDRCW